MSTPSAPPRPEGWWAYPPLFGAVVYVAGLVLPDLPWWTFGLAGVLVAGLAWLVADRVWWHGDYGVVVAFLARWGAAVACLAAGAWLAVASSVGALTAWQWLALGTAVVGCWWWLLMWLAPGAAARRLDRDAVPPTAAAVDPDAPPLVSLYSGILERSGSPDVRVLDVTVSPSGGVETSRITPAPTGRAKAITRTAFEGRLPSIVVEAARTLASRGIDLQDPDVTVEPGRNSAEFLLHVVVKRVLESPIPYVPDTTPQPWAGSKFLGRYEDDMSLGIALCDEHEGAAHVEMVGRTGGGKSVVLNNLVGRYTASDQGEVWLIGTSKLVKFAWDWLWPWLAGQTTRPVLDRVAGESPNAALRALADALHYAVMCNRSTPGNAARKPTRGRGALLVVIDEASDLLERNDLVIRVWDGRKMNASQLVAALQKVGRTSPVTVVKANQDALFDSLGSDGNKQRRNSTIGIALKVQRAGDATSVLPGMPGVNAAKLPRHHMYVQPATEEPRLMRAKAAEIEGALVRHVAEVNTAWRFGLDPALTSQLLYYRDRWDATWHQEFIERLADEDLAWPTTSPATARPATGEATPAPATPEPSPAQHDTTKPQEQPVSDQSTPDQTPADQGAGAVPVPDGWSDPEFDIWAAFDAADGVTAGGPVDAPASSGGPFGHTDTSAIEASLARVARFVRSVGATPAVPDPLGSVVAALSDPKAPQEWVSAGALAVVLGRVARDAGEVAVAGAAQQLGRELRAQVPTLETAQRTVGDRRPRGYRVADLRAAAEALRRQT